MLVITGAKILRNRAFGKLDPPTSLSVTWALLAGGIAFSLLRTRGASEGGAVRGLSHSIDRGV